MDGLVIFAGVNKLRHPLGVYYRINKSSVVEMQSAIADIGAIYVSAQVHDGWDRVTQLKKAPGSHDEADLPTIPERKGPGLGGHAFALVGYNDRGFIVQNSWGGRWGAAGFAVMPYSDWVQYGTDAWAMGMGVPQRHEVSPERLAAMAAAASGEGRPDAVERLADLVEFIASGGKPADFSARETRP